MDGWICEQVHLYFHVNRTRVMTYLQSNAVLIVNRGPEQMTLLSSSAASSVTSHCSLQIAGCARVFCRCCVVCVCVDVHLAFVVNICKRLVRVLLGTGSPGRPPRLSHSS